jgi:hypothetical protein
VVALPKVQLWQSKTIFPKRLQAIIALKGILNLVVEWKEAACRLVGTRSLSALIYASPDFKHDPFLAN